MKHKSRKSNAKRKAECAQKKKKQEIFVDPKVKTE